MNYPKTVEWPTNDNFSSSFSDQSGFMLQNVRCSTVLKWEQHFMCSRCHFSSCKFQKLFFFHSFHFLWGIRFRKGLIIFCLSERDPIIDWIERQKQNDCMYNKCHLLLNDLNNNRKWQTSEILHKTLCQGKTLL